MKRLYMVMSVLVVFLIMGCDNTITTVVAKDDNVSMSYAESSIDIYVIDNDFLIGDEATIVLTIHSDPTHGQASIETAADGRYFVRYMPEDGYEGTDVFEYHLSIGNSEGIGVIAVTVGNTAPVADAKEDQNLLIGSSWTFLGRGTDVEDPDSALTFEWKEGAEVLGNRDVLVYTPERMGVHTLTLTVIDTRGATGSDEVNVTVNGFNVIDARDDNVSMPNTQRQLNIDVLDNDILMGEVSTVALEIETDPSNGNAHPNIIGGKKVISYVPDDGFVGTDTFVYSATIGRVTETATVTVTVTEVPNTAITLEDLNLTVMAKGSASKQENGHTNTVHPIVENPTHGTARHFLQGGVPYIEYNSTGCSAGTDSFVYKNWNEYGRVNVTITVPALEATPDDSKRLKNNETIEAEDLVSNNPQILITTAPTHGTATLANPTHEQVSYNYDPYNDYIGDDFFIYTVTEVINGCTYTSAGRVDFTIESSNHKPSIALQGNSLIEIQQGSTYHDAGATATDNEDGDITNDIVVTSDVNTSQIGEYTVVYNVSDSQGSDADPVTRTVQVVAIGNSMTCSDMTLHDDIVVVGEQMWEDTDHAIPQYIDGVLANGKTYDEAYAYCRDLELGGFTDWKIPHAHWDGSGYTRHNNQMLMIRRQPLDENGMVWHNGQNYNLVDDNSRSIIGSFDFLNQTGGYWTDDDQGNQDMRTAVFFSYDLENADGAPEDINMSIRCVRDIDNEEAPLVIDAGADKTIVGEDAQGQEEPRVLAISGNVVCGDGGEYTYQWKYGDDVLSTESSFNYMPDHSGRNALVFQVTDASGNIASDVVHLNIQQTDDGSGNLSN